MAEGRLVNENTLTVTGKTLGENVAESEVLNSEVIRSLDTPYLSEGGLAVLWGNLAPEGAVVKQSAVVPEMLVHKGPARVFSLRKRLFKLLWLGKLNREMLW